MKIKIFEAFHKETLQDYVNDFLVELKDEQIRDIKLHCDPQVDPDWNLQAAYLAMVIYED